MEFSKHEGFLCASRITGPRHNHLEVIVSDASAQEAVFEFLPAIGGCSHAPLDQTRIVDSVMEGIALTNVRLGSKYAVERIRVPLNDTPPELVYGVLAAAIVERLHAGKSFGPE